MIVDPLDKSLSVKTERKELRAQSSGLRGAARMRTAEILLHRVQARAFLACDQKLRAWRLDEAIVEASNPCMAIE